MPPREKNPNAPIRRTRQAAPEPEAPRRERRALSHVGGEVTIAGGSAEEGEALSYALDVRPDEHEVMQDVHGFHSYPARMHPETARRLVERLSRPETRVLDPFCGSGTVVIEARALGRTALGSDLNPLAVELSWLKSRGFTRKFTELLVREAERIAHKAEDRRTEKAPPFVRYDDEDRERYPMHTLLELDSLTHGVIQMEHNEPKRALRLVLSSILTKVSYSEGDTTRMKAPRRLPPGFAIRLFVDKTREMRERLDEYLKRVPMRTPRAYVTHADARELGYVESGSVDLIVTSPPYPGVYDYLDHHLHRLKWLGLQESRLAQAEIGARREYRHLTLEQGAQYWREEIGHCLKEMRRVLTSDGRGVLIVADSVMDRRALRADTEMRIAAEQYGVDVMAIASQPRPLFLHGAEHAFGDVPRQEHVVIIRPSKAKKAFSGTGPQAFDGDPARPRARPDAGPREYLPRGPSNSERGPSHPRAPERRVRSDAGGRLATAPEERPYGRGASPDDSQRKTWGTRPSGPGKPRSRF